MIEHKIRKAVIGELLIMKVGYDATFEFGQVKRLDYKHFGVVVNGNVIFAGTAAQILKIYVGLLLPIRKS